MPARRQNSRQAYEPQIIAREFIRCSVASVMTETAPFDRFVTGVVEPGHGHASGLRSAKYPEGTINLQRPHFLTLGLDIRHCFAGTINLSIAPRTIRLVDPRIVLRNVQWKEGRKPENFFIGKCRIEHRALHLDAYIYFPDPSTKVSSFDDPSHFQLLSPHIPDIKYGLTLGMYFSSLEFEIAEPS